MTSGGKQNVSAAPASQRPPDTSTSHGNQDRRSSRSVMALHTTAGGIGEVAFQPHGWPLPAGKQCRVAHLFLL